MIILIGGWGGIRAGLIPLELGLRARLEREVTRADLGFGLGCIRGSAERAARLLDKMAAGGSDRVDVVGYSMGGLIATYLMKVLDSGKRIRSVVTLGTPHRGSPAVLLARTLLGRLSSSMAQMAPESDFLQKLSAAEVPIGSRLVSIASLDDGVVPALYAELPRRPRQDTCRIAGVTHLGLLFSRDAMDAVAAQLNQPAGLPALANGATVHVLRPRGAGPARVSPSQGRFVEAAPSTKCASGGLWEQNEPSAQLARRPEHHDSESTPIRVRAHNV